MRELMIALLILTPSLSFAQQLYQFPGHRRTGWVDFENPLGKKGMGGKANRGAKGHAWDNIGPGKSRVIFDVKGAGIIKRIWMTLSDKSPGMLRSLRVDMYWDGAATPAVSAPLGDFFGLALGRMASFQNALFSEAEGRSFNCFIPMPFRKGAKVVITNESGSQETLFYDIDYLKMRRLPRKSLYFHAYWSCNKDTRVGEDFTVLPRITGKGRFLGANFGIITDSIYGHSWWGEGEVKVYLDGDSTFPSLVGTGTEDYLGSGWGLGRFVNRYTGCLLADPAARAWAFYRYHIPDPIYFNKSCKVAIQQMGGDGRDNVRKLVQGGATLIPVSVTAPDYSRQWSLLDMKSPPRLTDSGFPLNWVNFYRKDNYSATVYFYLDKPGGDLPPLASAPDRMRGIAK